MIVLDASAVLELLLGTPAGARVAHRIESGRLPHIWQALAAPLLTLDARLSRSHGHRARVELIA